MSCSQRYILYIHPLVCVGSSKAIDILRNTSYNQLIFVQSILDLAQYPPWLNGTPCFVDQETKNIYKGSTALHHLENVIKAIPQRGSTEGSKVSQIGLDSSPIDETTDPETLVQQLLAARDKTNKAYGNDST